MRKLFLIIATTFISLSAFSQNIISGIVKDNEGKPVAFATLQFYSAKDTLHPETEKIADGTGIYFVQVKDTGSYLIKVSATGAKDTAVFIAVLGGVTKEDITLAGSTNNLTDVVVAAQSNPPMIQRKIDRVVMNVSNNPLTGGKSALELMNLAPSVFVDNNGGIAINGNNGTRVMVNGKLLQLSGEDLTNYLSNLRAEDIESLEVIAHPPAEYDAEGAGGLINIVLKKNHKAGLNGSVNAGYTQGRYAGTNEGVSLNYNKDKLTLFGNYSFDKLKSFGDNKVSRNSGDALLVDTSNRINHDQGNIIRLGGTYDISKKQYIGIEYNGSFYNSPNSYADSMQIIYPDVAQNQTVIGFSPHAAKSAYNNIGINYHLNTDNKGSEFVILSDYTHNSVNVYSGNQSTIYDYQHNYISDTSFGNHTPSTSKIFTADVHYKDVLSQATALSFGGKLSSTDIDNSATFNYTENGAEQINTPQNFDYVYKENIYAGYLNLNTSVFKTDVQAGLRGEYTNLTGTLTQLNNNQRNPDHYFGLFPSLFLKKNTDSSGANYFTFNYSRRVERPSFHDLNPYQFYVNVYMLAKGNPYLVPSYINSFELAYTLQNKYTATLSFDHQSNMVGEYWYQLPDSLLSIDTRQNFGNRNNLGLSFYIPVKITKWWQMQNDLGYNHITVDIQGYEIKKSMYHINSTHEFTLPGNFTASLEAVYYSAEQFGNFVTKPIFELNAGLQKKFFHNKLIAKVDGNDLFGLQRLNAISYSNTGNINFKSNRQWETFNLSLLYNFDLGKAFKTHTLESSSEDEKSRL